MCMLMALKTDETTMGPNELLRIQAEFKGVQNQIVNNTGATLVCPFSQAREPMLSFCKRYSNTRGGICEAIVARWIGDHANDVSLWDELLSYTTRGGEATYDININVINEITTQQHLGGLFNQDQLTYTSEYLRGRNVVAREYHASSHWGHPLGSAYAVGNSLVQIVNARRNNVGGIYAMFTVMRDDAGGHVMGAFIGSRGNDVAFFDPNYGDFWFERRLAFDRFFPDFIHNYYNAYNTYDVRTFVRA